MKLDNTMSAVISGGASGLGEATARALAARGVRVTIFDRDQQRGERVASDIGGSFAQVDVTSDEAVDAGFEHARSRSGQERICVNCAGIGTAMKTVGRDKATGEVKRHALGQFEATIQVNLIGTFRVLAASAAGMTTLQALDDGERGMIVNTASVAAQDGQVGQAAYSASKAGVLGMALPIARDLMAEGIRVNTILPGLFETPMLAALPEKVRDALGAQVPFPKRLGQPEEYARLVLFMAENAYLNAEFIRLDGGIRMAPR